MLKPLVICRGGHQPNAQTINQCRSRPGGGGGGDGGGGGGATLEGPDWSCIAESTVQLF